jgi:sigma-E factor negative regulatory protein RseA
MVMETISAFMDGAAGRAESKMTFLQLRQSDECMDAWETFHLIGDTLRGEPVLSQGFTRRFTARLEDEPLLLAPRIKWRRSVNYALSAAASLAAVAVVLTLVLAENPLRPTMPIAAIAPTEVAKSTPVAIIAPAPVIPVASSQSGFNEYLMAHQGFSPSTVLQGVAPYVRSVSSTQDGTDR